MRPVKLIANFNIICFPMLVGSMVEWKKEKKGINMYAFWLIDWIFFNKPSPSWAVISGLMCPLKLSPQSYSSNKKNPSHSIFFVVHFLFNCFLRDDLGFKEEILPASLILAHLKAPLPCTLLLYNMVSPLAGFSLTLSLSLCLSLSHTHT